MHFDDALRDQIERRLGSFELHRAIPGAHRVAAVAVTIVEEGEGARLAGIPAPSAWSREAALILTRRALHLRTAQPGPPPASVELGVRAAHVVGAPGGTPTARTT